MLSHGADAHLPQHTQRGGTPSIRPGSRPASRCHADSPAQVMSAPPRLLARLLTPGAPRCSTLITKVRRAKTAAEERAIIKQESAYIRTVLGSEPSRHAKRNLVKLMYMRMLGYPSEFGQVPCLALITKGDYSAKARPHPLPQPRRSRRPLSPVQLWRPRRVSAAARHVFGSTLLSLLCRGPPHVLLARDCEACGVLRRWFW